MGLNNVNLVSSLLLSMKSKSIQIFVFVSILLTAFHLVYLHTLLPWVDEVMFMDSPMNYINGKGWITHSWYSRAHEVPFMYYPPLYTFMVTPWMQIFGTSLEAARSLYLIITFLIGLGLLKTAKLIGHELSLYGTLCFALLLWMSSDMAYMFRNGRPDLIGALLVVLYVNNLLAYRKRNTYVNWISGGIAALILMSGIQNFIYLLLLLIIGICFLNDYRLFIVRQSKWTVLGGLAGFSLCLLYMFLWGHLMGFLENIACYSGAMKTMASITLPVLQDITHIDFSYYIQKLSEPESMSDPFYFKLFKILAAPSFSIVLVACFILGLCRKSKLNRVLALKGLFAVSVGIPLLMSVAGRFTAYYYWMALLPLFLLFSILSDQRKLKTFLLSILSCITICVLGLINICKDNRYGEVRSMIEDIHEFEGKKIVAPFSVFYEVNRYICDSYYVDGYSEKYIPEDIDYVIVNEDKKSKTMKFLEMKLKNPNVRSRIIAENENSKMRVYELSYSKTDDE